MPVILEALGTTFQGFFSEAVGPLFGALFGAYSAFRLETWRQKRKEGKERADAIRRCQSALGYYERTVSVLAPYLSPLRDHEHRWRKLGSLAGPSPSLEVEPSSLVFLVDLGREDLLAKVVDCHSAHSSVLTTVELRRAAQERFWFAVSRVEEGARNALMSADPDRLDEIIGPAVTGPLKSLTDALYQLVPETLAVVRSTQSELEEVLQTGLRSDRQRTWLPRRRVGRAIR